MTKAVSHGGFIRSQIARVQFLYVSFTSYGILGKFLEFTVAWFCLLQNIIKY